MKPNKSQIHAHNVSESPVTHIYDFLLKWQYLQERVSDGKNMSEKIYNYMGEKDMQLGQCVWIGITAYDQLSFSSMGKEGLKK